MHSLRVVLLVLGVVMAHRQTNALKCYECRSRTPDESVNCREPFDSTSIPQPACTSTSTSTPAPRCYTNANYNPGKRTLLTTRSTTARITARGQSLEAATKPRSDVHHLRFPHSMLNIFATTKKTISVRVIVIIGSKTPCCVYAYRWSCIECVTLLMIYDCLALLP